MRFWVVVVTVAVAVAVGESAASSSPERASGRAASPAAVPAGWGRERLGMPLAELRELYPDAKLTPASGPPFDDPRVQRWLRLTVREPDLPEPVDIEYRTWEGKLWMVLVYTGKNPVARVRRALEQRFGPPADSGLSPAWLWPDRKVVTHLEQHWFAVIHRPTDREARSALQPRAR